MLKQNSKRHHYIPCFYKKLWSGEDGRFCQYSRPIYSVKAQKKFPKQVGFGTGLYDLTGLPEDRRSIIEDKFFAPADHIASVAVQKILEKRTTSLPPKLRNGFARLLTSFFHRTPDRIEQNKERFRIEMRKIIEEIKREPKKFLTDEVIQKYSMDDIASQLMADVDERAWGISLMNTTDSKLINTAIINMKWLICDLSGSRYSLLTSDKPLVHNNGFGKSYGHLCLALGPKKLFIATHNRETFNSITSVGEERISKRFNHEVTSQAQKYVYGVDDSQLRFVENRLVRPKKFI